MIELTLNGICFEYDFRALIVTGAGAAGMAARSKWHIAAQGEIKLHLCVALFDRPFVFTPTRIITERQQVVEGEVVKTTIAARRVKLREQPRSSYETLARRACRCIPRCTPRCWARSWHSTRRIRADPGRAVF